MTGSNSEEAAEFVTTVRTEHVKMKEWYTSDQSAEVKALKEKYGSYPSMWKEVLNWPGWKEARKEYLKQQQLGEKKADSNNTAIPRKRKSRWGSATPAAASATKRFAAPGNNNNQEATRVVLPNLPGMNPNLNPQQQAELKTMQAKLRAVNERLENLEKEAARVDALPRGHRERSPSPPPIYGADGKRKNTRAVRWRERYTAERQDLLEGIMRLSSKGPQSGALGLPGASSLLVRKRAKKIRIPIEEHPNYNFIGLIIGPRGKTQKELEAKTGCKIAIRGRGSVKEGARGRRDGKVMEGDNEPLHVVITGDNQRAVDAASDMVEQMLVVIDDEKNVHKQQQLRELALLNGTLKEEDVFCQICAEKGHRSFECPKRFSKGGAGGLSVKCAICGDSSHPTRDCPRKNAPGVAGGPGAPGEDNHQKIDSEYLSFMAELDGKKPEPASDNKSVPPADINLPPPPRASPNLPPPPSSNGPPRPPNAQPPSFGGHPSQPSGPPPAQPSGQPPDSTYGHYRPAQQYNNHHSGPPPGGNVGHYGHQNGHQQQYGGYGQQQPPPNGQQNGQQQQQQQQGHVQPGQETAGWDPSAYYGSYGGGNNNAGGFNWWE